MSATEEDLRGVFAEFTRVSNAIRRGRLEERAMAHAGIDVERPALTILITLQTAEQPLRIGEIASRMQVVGPHVTRHLPDLEQRGLVRRVIDPGDSRARLIEVTPQGRDVVTSYLGAVLGWMRDVLDEWSDQDRAAFLTLVRRFADEFATKLQWLED
ncbi:MarR family winged helix-turn-helix transcriptional regulator [Cryptosporangium sp. NPDC051539]|uniref:MarR family winged helix-turn-helix transcriptional regulator n=1 Tax=Cryptosporangium sp. NPDC051539 TaxID=3363962 RepID=UPI003799139E